MVLGTAIMFLLVFIFIGLYASDVIGLHFSSPDSCDSQETWFKTGQMYTYSYQLESSSGVSSSSQPSSSHHVICDVIISVPRNCEVILYTENCIVRTSEGQIDTEKSEHLALEMGRNPVHFKYSKGEVIEHEIYVHTLDTQPIRNLKRGIISLLQLKILSTKEQYDSPSNNYDVLGSCEAQTTLVPGEDHQMETYVDLSFCNHTGPLSYQNSLFSMVKSIIRGNPLPALTQLINPVESNVLCKYTVKPELLMEEARCVQQHLYSPVLFNEALETNIRQSLKLVSKEALTSRAFPRNLFDYATADLAMEFDDHSETNLLGYDLERLLEDFRMEMDFRDLEEKRKPAKTFKSIVSKLRNAEEEDIRDTKNSIFNCQEDGACFEFATQQLDQSIAQELKRKAFVSGLMSCASEPCLLVLAEMFQEDHIKGMDSLHILFNMGLSYQSPVRVMERIHDFCRRDTKMSQCWFSISAMLSRFEITDLEEKQQRDVLYSKVVQDLYSHIGTKCRHQSTHMNRAQKIAREDSVLIALKTFSNMGPLPGDFQDKDRLVSTLMDCVLHSQEDVIISLNAINTLTKMDLLEESTERLKSILQDDNAEMALRTAIVDAFIVQERPEQLLQLLSLMETTKLETMKTYIVTKVVSILESPNPALFGLQELIQELMSSQAIPNVKGILSKSHYAEMSHYFTIPLTSLSLGESIGVRVVLSPNSNFIQTFTVKIGFVLNGKSTDVFEATVYLEGVDTLMDLIRDLKEKPSEMFQTDFLETVKVYLNDIIAKGKTPTFDFLDVKLLERMTKIFTEANMKSSTFPKAHVAIKLLDYDVMFFSSDHVLKHLKQSKQFLGKRLLRALLKPYHLFLLIGASKLKDFHQTIPSIGGIPVQFDLDTTLVTGVDVNSMATIEHRSKWNKEFIFDWSMAPRVSISQDAKVGTRLDGIFDTDLRHEVWINGFASLAADVKTRPHLFQKHPVFYLDITKHLGQDIFTFLDMGSETFVVTNGDKTPCIRPESSQLTFEKCLPDIYTKMTGHRVCLNGSYSQHSAEGQTSTMPPLPLASTRISGMIIPSDRELKRYDFNGFYQTTSGDNPDFRVHVNFEGRGSEFSRSLFLSIHRASPNFDCQLIIEDVDVVFSMRSINTEIDHSFSKAMSVSITQEDFTTHSLGYWVEREVDGDTGVEKESFLKANGTLAGGDLSLQVLKRKTNRSPTTTSAFIELNYHCKPSLPLLYALHPDPIMASKSGHVSKFSLVTEAESSPTSFADTWTGRYIDVLTLPGHHISHTSRFVADLTDANRTTFVTWTTGRKQHNYTMVGHVKNRTLSGMNQYDYQMHLEKSNAYVVDFTGNVTWTPRAGFNVSGNVNYESIDADVKNTPQRRKRSLSSILNELRLGGKRMEEKAMTAYAAAKTKILTIWNRQQESTSDSEVNIDLMLPQSSMLFQEGDYLEEDKTKSTILELPKWSVSFNTAVSMNPDIVKTPAGMRMVGMGCDWLTNVTTSGGDETLLQSSGSFYRGRNFRASAFVEDSVHRLMFRGDVEHTNNDELLYHYHNWYLSPGGQDNNKNSNQERNTNSQAAQSISSSEVRFRFQKNVFPQLPQLLLDVNASNPMGNLTYHLNYTKEAARRQKVCVKASVTSDWLPFSLQYRESTNVSGRTLQSSFQMNSTFFNYTLALVKSPTRKGLSATGDFRYKIKLPFYAKESNASVQIDLTKNQPPVCQIRHHPAVGQGGIEATMRLLGPKRIQLTIKTFPEPLVSNQTEKTLLVWTVILKKPRVLQHTLNVSELVASMVEDWDHKTLRASVGIDNNTNAIKVATPKDSQDAVRSNKLNATQTQTHYGSKVKNVVNSLRATWKYLWESSVPGKIYRTFQFDDGYDLVSNFMAKTATTIIHRPPFAVRQFAKLYVRPHLRAVLRGRLTTMTMSLPFVWESFKQLPQGTMTDKKLLEEMRLSKSVSPYRDVAMLLDSKWVRTFDGQWFNIGDTAENECTHLMAADLRRKRFAIVYSKTDGLRVLSTRSGIVLTTTGGFSSLDGVPISSLPFTTKDKEITVTLDNGSLAVLLSNGLARLTFDAKLNMYFFEVAQQLNNVSIGLWGTNNQEAGDDFRLPRGAITESPRVLQQAYELSRGQRCLGSGTASSSCENYNEANSVCQNFFQRNTKVATCAQQIDPEPFKSLCESNECLGGSGCVVVQAYASVCTQKGLDTQSPTECEPCQGSNSDTPKMDIVFVQSLHENVIGENDVFEKAITIAKSLPSSDVKMGFVSFGGRGPYLQPVAHLINQRLLTSVRDYVIFSSSAMSLQTSSNSMSPEVAINLAANFPFRQGSNRLIILIHSLKANETSIDESKLTNILTRQRIRFLSATSRPDYNTRGIVGVLYTNQTADGHRQETTNNEFGTIVKDTKGAWLSTDLLTTAENNFLQIFESKVTNCYQDV